MVGGNLCVKMGVGFFMRWVVLMRHPLRSMVLFDGWLNKEDDK